MTKKPFWLLLLVLFAAPLAAAESGGDGDVAARIGDHKISLADVDREAMSSSIEPYQKLYDARQAALNGLIESHLLDQEARSRGISTADLIAKEITAKAGPVTDADIKAFFEQNQARMGGRTLEEVSPAIRDYLGAINVQRARQGLIDSLRAKSSIRVSLEAPRAEVIIAGNDPFKGPGGAPVTIVEYSDFQ